MMSISESHWNAVNSQTARLAHSISTVSELTELLTPSLSRADQKLDDIQTKTVDLSRSTEWLQDVILNMTERALSDMRKLDASAHKIQESLQLPSFQLFRFFNSSGLLAQMSQKGYIALLIILLRFVVKFARLLFSQSLSILLGILWVIRCFVTYTRKFQVNNDSAKHNLTRDGPAPTLNFQNADVIQATRRSPVFNGPRVSAIPDRLCNRSRRL
ncbi:hypothetical protein BJ165DRAFT_271427 [Panaeolus papilionaceus]|nr:hypothetical protein BJ165DRAFT_271427 [Panaeolus papilionaceus]